jgi:hypothetical protein
MMVNTPKEMATISKMPIAKRASRGVWERVFFIIFISPRAE